MMFASERKIDRLIVRILRHDRSCERDRAALYRGIANVGRSRRRRFYHRLITHATHCHREN